MLKNIKFISIFTFFVLFCTIFLLSEKAQASGPSINNVSPTEVSLGQDIVIEGNNFGDKKGTVFIGEEKYPYYGHNVSYWSNSKIILTTNTNTNFVSGKIGIQKWSENSYGLEDVIYGQYIIIKPLIRKVSQNNTSNGTSLNIVGMSFKSFGNTKPQVFVNDKLIDVEFWTDSSIRANLPNNINSGFLKIKFGDDINGITIKSDYIGTSNTIDNKVELIDQWYLEAINVFKAKEIYKGGKNVVVAVIDDGIYLNHPNLKNNIWKNNNEIPNNNIDDDQNGLIDDINGWNFVEHSNNMNTQGTHGTMVAGIIGSQGGVDGLTEGINYNVSLMPIIISDSNAYVSANNINKAIYYAVDNGADIINLSLGGLPYNYSDGFDESISYAFDNNVLVVAAAGNGDVTYNSGVDLDNIKISPVCNDGDRNMVLGVGASNKNNSKANWSNYGLCVDIYAPGLDITSTADPTHNKSGELYKISSGTSFSTPIVSGTAALIKSKYPNISNIALMNRIINNSRDIDGVKIVDVYEAISQNFSSAELATSHKNIKQIEGIKIVNQDIDNYIIKQRELLGVIDNKLAGRLSGRILLQVEDKGEAWYIFPDNNKRYYLGTADSAYELMKKLSLGAKHDFIVNTKIFPKRLAGKILIDVEKNGEAYYINPLDKKAYYMKDGEASYNIMRQFGLGISNSDIQRISIGQI